MQLCRVFWSHAAHMQSFPKVETGTRSLMKDVKHWKHLFFTLHEFSLETYWACSYCIPQPAPMSPGVLLTFLSAICWHLVYYLWQRHNLLPSQRCPVPHRIPHYASVRQKTTQGCSNTELTLTCLAMLTLDQRLWAAALQWWKSTCSTGLWFAWGKVEHIVWCCFEATKRERVEGWWALSS